jgi:CheY-like chemotaxis protein
VDALSASILVVEDNQDNIQLVDYLLRAHGYEPRLATDGATGLQIALEERPELILLDLRMPGMDGYEVARLVSEAGLEATNVVALTASAMVGDRERIAECGFDGYIQKPIDPETFIADIERFLPGEAP